MTSFLCEILFTCTLAAPGAKPVDELTYGTALYHYYQDDYDGALLDVMVAERQGRMGERPVRFELAKGSFAFQDGMYRMAADTFRSVDQSELTELDHMRLAFHMAREYYRRGDWQRMESELADIDLGGSWLGRKRRHPEVTFMRAEGAMARGDFAAAEAALDTLPARSEYLAYGLFNLGVAYRQAGDARASHAAFSRLAQLESDTDEGRDLVQRGRLALAVMARQTGDVVDAQTMLGTLPGKGRYRDLALASYGNLAMVQENYDLGARIWLTVLDQPGWNSSHATAYLGLPMSLEKLASPAHALDRYREAERVFEARLASLQKAAARAGDPVWVDELLDVFSNPDDAVRVAELSRFDQGLGTATWLEWLSGEHVHQVMVEWRELNEMAAWLGRLPTRIDAFEEVTREQRRRSAAAGKMLNDEALLDRRAALADSIVAQQADIEALRSGPAIRASSWMLRLADHHERALIEDLDRMRALAKAHMEGAERARVEARIRRLEGVVFWTIADSKAERVRRLASRLDENRRLLADVDARMDRLAGAERRFAAGVETDFLAFTDRAGDVSERVADALDQRRRVIARALDRGLEEEMARTRQYLLTARIAIARATDQLAGAPAADDGGDS